MKPQFIHLRVHTEYSLSDGIVRIPRLVDQCVDHEMPAVAVTDLNNLFGLIKFYNQAEILRKLHQEQHPDYKYSPKARKPRVSPRSSRDEKQVLVCHYQSEFLPVLLKRIRSTSVHPMRKKLTP